MKLLIVVDKLLTGFDAPSGDLSLHRQADAGPRPIPGHLPGQPPRRRRQGIRLRHRLQRPVPVAGGRPLRTTRARHSTGYDKADVEGLLKDRLQQGTEAARGKTRGDQGAVRAGRTVSHDTAKPICTTSVTAGTGDTARQLAKTNEPKRVMRSTSKVAAFLRAYANLANEMIEAGSWRPSDSKSGTR